MKTAHFTVLLFVFCLLSSLQVNACFDTNMSTDSTSCYNKCDGVGIAAPTGGTSPYTYQWDGFTGGQVSASATGLCPGKYFITITDAALCTVVDSVIIFAPDSIKSSVVSNSVTCKGLQNGGATITATGGEGNFGFNWSSGEITPSISNKPANVYYVLITDGDGCTSVDSAEVNEPAAMSFNLTFIPLSCHGDCNGYADISVAGGTAPYNYNWLPAPTSGQGTANPTGMCGGAHKVYITDDNGCKDSIPFSLSEPDPIQLTYSTTNETCKGVCDGTAEVLATGGKQPYNYNWNNGKSALELGNLCADDYSVTVTDKNKCTITQTMNVAPGAENPVADFYFTPEKTNIREPEVRFYQTSSENVTDWNWTFFDEDEVTILDTDITYNPIYEYGEKGGTYPVKLEVMNNSGCGSEIVKYVFIDEIYQLFVPDAFTPNGDGLNDLFIPVGKGINENAYQMNIYNRWGQMVFSTKDPTTGWRGDNTNGTIAESGVYVWKITLTDRTASKLKHDYTGHVTLVN